MDLANAIKQQYAINERKGDTSWDDSNKNFKRWNKRKWGFEGDYKWIENLHV